MIKNETNLSIVDNLYSLASHHKEHAIDDKAVATVGVTQVQTEQAIVPAENQKGQQINIKA